MNASLVMTPNILHVQMTDNISFPRLICLWIDFQYKHALIF